MQRRRKITDFILKMIDHDLIQETNQYLKEKEKILRFLAYRGFSYEIIKNAQKDIE